MGRYVGIERLIEENKARYYETLEQGSAGWHEGGNDPWSYVNFVLATLKSAYGEMERQVENTASARGSKTALVEAAIHTKAGPFSVVDLERACPGVSDMIRRVLGQLRANGEIESLGRGPGATWRKKG